MKEVIINDRPKTKKRLVSETDIEREYLTRQLWIKRAMTAVYMLANVPIPEEYRQHQDWVIEAIRLRENTEEEIAK